MRAWPLLFAAAGFCFVSSQAVGAQHPNRNGVPADLLSKLTRGVNVTRWFCYTKPDDKAHFRSYLGDQDFAAFRRIGVKFVRLCISPDVVYRSGHARGEVMPDIDRALDRFSRAGIAVIWDLHDNGQLKLDEPGHDDSGFVSFWQDIARHYRGSRERQVMFELLNEPVFMRNPTVWYALQRRTVAAIRKIDPSRTIMVSGTQWSSLDRLADLPLLPEKNLVYTVHCYDPFLFTHQGASWVGDPPKGLRQVPFPSSPEAVASVIDLQPEHDRASIEDYGRKHFDANYLWQRLSIAKDWSVRNHLPVVLGEFGAFPAVSPPKSRARWFAAMRRAISELGIRSSVWGYDDALGLGRRMEGGKLWLDPLTLENLYGVASRTVQSPVRRNIVGAR